MVQNRTKIMSKSLDLRDGEMAKVRGVGRVGLRLAVVSVLGEHHPRVQGRPELPNEAGRARKRRDRGLRASNRRERVCKFAIPATVMSVQVTGWAAWAAATSVVGFLGGKEGLSQRINTVASQWCVRVNGMVPHLDSSASAVFSFSSKKKV